MFFFRIQGYTTFNQPVYFQCVGIFPLQNFKKHQFYTGPVKTKIHGTIDNKITNAKKIYRTKK